MQKRRVGLILSFGFLAALNACQSPTLTKAEANALNAPEVQSASSDAAKSIGCSDLESHLWDVSYALVLNQNDSNKATFHSENIGQKVLSSVENTQSLSAKDKADLNLYLQKFFQIHENILNSQESTQDKMKVLTGAELGKSTDQDSKTLQEQLKKWRGQLQDVLKKDGVSCGSGSPSGTAPSPETGGSNQTQKPPAKQVPSTVTTTPSTAGESVLPPTSNQTSSSASSNPSTTSSVVSPTFGNETGDTARAKTTLPSALALSTAAKKTLAVAYQSCELEALPPLNKTTAAASGIKALGKTSDGATVRKITDVQSFVSTQYYYRDFSLKNQCSDVRENPMIYNFGGKPNVRTKSKVSSIDLFSLAKNTPGVSPQLGIDCSAYVFTSIATSGLRLSANTQLKPVLIYGVDSDMFLDPKSNGMSCLDKVKMGASGTLQAGDIIAESGHVAIIGEAGLDPLGLSHARSEADCDKLSYQNFDFVVYQSSASKDGIGINKFIGKDYVLEDPLFRKGLVEYAQQACHAKFAGTNVVMQSKSIQVDRFSDSASCRQEATPLVGESCVSECF